MFFEIFIELYKNNPAAAEDYWREHEEKLIAELTLENLLELARAYSSHKFSYSSVSVSREDPMLLLLAIFRGNASKIANLFKSYEELSSFQAMSPDLTWIIIRNSPEVIVNLFRTSSQFLEMADKFDLIESKKSRFDTLFIPSQLSKISNLFKSPQEFIQFYDDHRLLFRALYTNEFNTISALFTCDQDINELAKKSPEIAEDIANERNLLFVKPKKEKDTSDIISSSGTPQSSKFKPYDDVLIKSSSKKSDVSRGTHIPTPIPPSYTPNESGISHSFHLKMIGELTLVSGLGLLVIGLLALEPISVCLGLGLALAGLGLFAAGRVVGKDNPSDSLSPVV